MHGSSESLLLNYIHEVGEREGEEALGCSVIPSSRLNIRSIGAAQSITCLTFLLVPGINNFLDQ